MATGRVLHAELQLLDHQLRDRDGRLCGNVDDLELGEVDGQWYVTALLSGPGTLLRRLKGNRLGRWLERFRRETARRDGFRSAGEHDDPGRIPMMLVHRIGPAIDIAVSADQLASSQTEIWIRDHIIGHIPGSRHDEAE